VSGPTKVASKRFIIIWNELVYFSHYSDQWGLHCSIVSVVLCISLFVHFIWPLCWLY